MLSVSKKRKKTFYLFILSLIGINNWAHKRRADKGGHKHRTESKALSALWVNEARPWKDARILSPLFPRLQGWRSTLSSDQAFRTCKRGCGYIRMPTYSCRLTLIFDEQVLFGGLWSGSGVGCFAILKLMNLDTHRGFTGALILVL